MLLALQKGKGKENISPGLPNSFALCSFHLAVSAGFFQSREEKKKWKFAKISNEIDDQRNSTAGHLQSFSFVLLLQLR